MDHETALVRIQVAFGVRGRRSSRRSRCADEPALALALVQTRFATGTHELYQIVVSGPEEFDAVGDPREALELVRLIDQGADVDTEDGHFSFRHVEGVVAIPDNAEARVIGVEQSNSSIVFADRLVLKVFRKLEPGINPELEILNFLTRRDFPNIAPLHGWYRVRGPRPRRHPRSRAAVPPATPSAAGSSPLSIQATPSSCSSNSATSARSPPTAHRAGLRRRRPGLLARGASQESLSLLTATIDEDMSPIFMQLPERADRADRGTRKRPARALAMARDLGSSAA